MADYYPLIHRAIQGLSDRSPAMRQAVYERARSALMGQLRQLDPPLPEADIEQESRSLAAAIERIEAEFRPLDPEPAAPPAPAPLSDTAPPPIPVAMPPLPNVAAEPIPERAPEADPDLPPPPINLPSVARSHRRASLPERGRSLTFPTAAGPIEPGVPADDAPIDAEYTDADAPVRPRVDSRSPVTVRSGRGRSLVLGASLLLVIGAIAVAAWFLRDTPEQLPRPAAVAEAPPQPAEGSKLNERVGGGPPPPPAAALGTAPPNAAPEAGATERAVLYEEDPANPQVPRATAGRTVWRLDAVNAGQGQALETVIRANLDIPEAGFALAMLIRRNLDPTLPASHTVELSFTTRAGETGRVVRDIGLLQFKNEPGARGTPVAGLPVPVRENLFLIGLSNLPGDVERNMELLRNRTWIDLPIRTAAGQRAIVSIEKGAAGRQVVSDAFQQWR